MTPSPDPISILAAQVLRTMPADPQQQVDLLQAVFVVISPKHPARADIRSALENAQQSVREQAALKRNTELAQLKFAALLGGTPKPETLNRRNGPTGNGNTPAK